MKKLSIVIPILNVNEILGETIDRLIVNDVVNDHMTSKME